MISSLLSIFYPPVCHICGSRLAAGEKDICAQCREHLPRTLYHRYPFNPMEQSLAGFVPIGRATGLFFYAPDTPISQMVQDVKYRGYSSLAVTLGEMMAEELAGTDFFRDVDFLVPIPITLFKRMRRGYNQTELIAHGVGNILGIPVVKALKAVRGHPTQTGLSHTERSKNVEGVFAVSDTQALAGKHLMIIDDICTTGSTIVSAARVLLSGIADVCVSAVTFGVAGRV